MRHSTNPYKRVETRTTYPSNDGLSTLEAHHLVGFGDRLREERKRLGLTQGGLAELASITSNTQLNYEKGVRQPDTVYLAAVADAGMDVLYLITGQRTPSKEEGLSPPESAVLDNFRALSEEDRKAVHRLTNALAQSQADGGSGEGTG